MLFYWVLNFNWTLFALFIYLFYLHEPQKVFCFYPLWLTGECSASSDLVGRRVGGAWCMGQINKSDSGPRTRASHTKEANLGPRSIFEKLVRVKKKAVEPLIGSSGTTGGVRPSTHTHTRTHSLSLAQLQLHVKVWTQSFAAAQFIFLFSFLFCSSSVRSAGRLCSWRSDLWPPHRLLTQHFWTSAIIIP